MLAMVVHPEPMPANRFCLHRSVAYIAVFLTGAEGRSGEPRDVSCEGLAEASDYATEGCAENSHMYAGCCTINPADTL